MDYQTVHLEICKKKLCSLTFQGYIYIINIQTSKLKMTKTLYNTPRISTKYEYLHDIRDCAVWLWERCLNGNTNYW